MTLALVTNDDGIDSPGLRLLALAALSCGCEVVVAAPSWDSSGASASLTGVRDDGRLLYETRQLEGVDGPAFAVDASPALITLTARRGGFGEPPDLVLSGINRGRNTGHAVLHSGTVGAPLTALNDGAPGIAVSLDADDPAHWDTAALVAADVIRWVVEDRPTTVINLNVPDLPFADLAGLREAPLAAVGAVKTNVTDVQRGFVQLTYESLTERPEPATDAALLDDGWATVTSLRPVCDTTPSGSLERLTTSTGVSPSGSSGRRGS